MENINERTEIINDNPTKLAASEKPTDEIQFLLTYEANKVLHKKNIKKIIVNFLNIQKATGICCYSNSAIHFRLKEIATETLFVKLNREFENYILSIEGTDGKIFWTFNMIATTDGKKRSIIYGRGNKTLNDEFQKQYINS